MTNLKQRGKLKVCVNKLLVNGKIYKSDNEILGAWREHFEVLATPVDHKDFDDKYRQQVESEVSEIMDMCSSSSAHTSPNSVSMQQVKEAIESINRGKAADFHGVTIEHFLYGIGLRIASSLPIQYVLWYKCCNTQYSTIQCKC